MLCAKRATTPVEPECAVFIFVSTPYQDEEEFEMSGAVAGPNGG